MKIVITLSNNLVLSDQVNIVQSLVPFLIGFCLLHKNQMIINNVDNVLSCPPFRCKIPLTQKRGILLGMAKSHRIHYSHNDLLKIHRNASHFSSDNLLNLLKLVIQWKADYKSKELFTGISSTATFFNASHSHRFGSKYHIL